MDVYFKIGYEAIRQALDSMRSSKLRTFLSLLGITIGIFCIIAVKSAVDSLKDNILSGFNELGSDVIYIDKMPWNEDPNENYWKYAKRPNPSIEDLEAILRKSKLAANAAYTVFTGGRSIKYQNNSISNAFIMGSTFEYPQITDVNFEKGRFFTKQEYESGANKVIIGGILAEALFGLRDPEGQTVKLFGQDYTVVGVLKKEGENSFNFLNFDEVIWISYRNMQRFVNTKDDSSVGRMLNAKAIKDVPVDQLKEELTGIMRAQRRIKPREENNFAINEISALSTIIESVFGVLNAAGFLIGIFSLIVGMFSVANIMFVSVKERTSIIGIKKAIGARRNIILLEFLVEAVILCLFGGIIGLLMVWGVLSLVTSMVESFPMHLSVVNLIIGLASSIIVGIIAGVLPAIKASNLDPVEAIRS